MPAGGGSREAAVAVVERLIDSHPEISAARVGAGAFAIVIPGEVRLRIPVGVRVGERVVELSCFLLRGPRGPSAAALHRLLLRKGAATRWARLVLDGDDDVLIAARLPTVGLTEEVLEELLGEVYMLSETSFEPLVHLAYPGVFPPLRQGGGVRPSAAPAAGSGPDSAGTTGDHSG